MEIVGLTGGIASGKSTVAKMLRASGVVVIDADQLARDVVMPGTDGLAQIVATFGREILDENGALDRKRLGAIIFADADKRRTLNAIVHPKVAERFQQLTSALDAEGVARVVYEVPLLFENGLDRLMNASILVVVPPEVQVARLMARDQISRADALLRIGAQMPLADKVARATVVVDNAGSIEETRASMSRAWQRVAGEPLSD
jgi:dephospho-CoA kinase